MFEFLAGVLAALYEVWPSYGGAIILFTLAIMLVLSPLAIKSTRSMIAMQRLGPEMKRLQAKHKDDKQALNTEMMAFYKENNINPFSSCLPLLLQMPVFIVLYRVLDGLTNKVDGGDTFEPSYLDEGSKLYQDLLGQEEMRSFGMDLSEGALGVVGDSGIITALPYLVLVGIVVLTGFVQQRQIAGRNPNAAANPQQQMIGRIMPFIFIPISISIAAGVVLYFATSNLVRIGQQALVTRMEFGKLWGAGDPPAPGLKDGKGGQGEKDPKEGKAPKDDVIDTTGREGGKPGPSTNGRGNGSGSKKPSTNGNGSGQRPVPPKAGAGGSSSRPRNKKRKRK